MVAVFIPALAIPQQPLIAFSIGLVAFVSLLTTTRGETESWFTASWDFAKQIMPLLFGGVLVACRFLFRAMATDAVLVDDRLYFASEFEVACGASPGGDCCRGLAGGLGHLYNGRYP